MPAITEEDLKRIKASLKKVSPQEKKSVNTLLDEIKTAKANLKKPSPSTSNNKLVDSLQLQLQAGKNNLKKVAQPVEKKYLKDEESTVDPVDSSANLSKRQLKKQAKTERKQLKQQGKQELSDIKNQTKLDKKELKQQSKVDKAQLQQDAQKQEYDLNQQRARQNIETQATRQQALSDSRYIPYNAQDRSTSTHSTEDQPVAIRNTTPDQDIALQKLFQILPQGIQGLNMPGSQSNFQPIADEARRNFSQNTIPTLAERFAGLGRNSSGLQQTLGGAAAQFESQLAAAQAQHGLQEQSLQSSNLFNSLGAFLQPQQDTTIIPGRNSSARNALNTAKGLAYDVTLGSLQGGGGLGALGSAFKALLGGGGQQQQMPSNGSGAGANSVGFGGVQKGQNNWQPSPSPQLSVQQLASAGYPQLNNIFNQRPY